MTLNVALVCQMGCRSQCFPPTCCWSTGVFTTSQPSLGRREEETSSEGQLSGGHRLCQKNWILQWEKPIHPSGHLRYRLSSLCFKSQSHLNLDFCFTVKPLFTHTGVAAAAPIGGRLMERPLPPPMDIQPHSYKAVRVKCLAQGHNGRLLWNRI